jgi:SAM-dependent methyltransferase
LVLSEQRRADPPGPPCPRPYPQSARADGHSSSDGGRDRRGEWLSASGIGRSGERPGEAVEISADAIGDGRKRYPDIEFLSGLACDLPVETGRQLDLVIISFVLHWIDRSTLLRSVAEIDRVVRPLGHLVIADFLRAAPERVDYHHLPGADVWTYKQDYAEVFVASSLYEHLAIVTIFMTTTAGSRRRSRLRCG